MCRTTNIQFYETPPLLAFIGLLMCLAVDLSAQGTVRVVFVSGQTLLQRPEEPALRPAIKGETVIIGTRISAATTTFALQLTST